MPASPGRPHKVPRVVFASPNPMYCPLAKLGRPTPRGLARPPSWPLGLCGAHDLQAESLFQRLFHRVTCSVGRILRMLPTFLHLTATVEGEGGKGSGAFRTS